MSFPQIRQGDVLLQPIPRPRRLGDAKAADRGRHILVHGEATGHHHSVAAAHACYYTSPLAAEGLGVLEVLHETELVHQEHDPITLPAGFYVVRRQREYSPEAIRNVAD